MSEAIIIRSPHAYVPKEHLTEEERKELYRTRIDESFKPYTVIDVLNKVYHRSFTDDLKNFIGKHPRLFQKKSSEGWAVSNIWVNECRVIRPESIFNQPRYDFLVDIAVETRVRIEEVMPGNGGVRRNYNIKPKVWLRYCFNLVPCELTCRFETAFLDERYSLLKTPGAIPVDKYLLPVLKEQDYIELAEFIIEAYFPPEIRDNDVPVDPAIWAREMKCRILDGFFPDDGALGEYFFGFGTADIIDPETGKTRNSDINPGTIVINKQLMDQRGQKNTTVAHECTHRYLGDLFFLLQRTHGHDYCSYMCKRISDIGSAHDKWQPVDIMEMHANKFPGYLMIRQRFAKAHAQKLLDSYGGNRSLENMRRLVDDMAEFYGSTKTMARKRLIDFGFTEARGIMQSVEGKLVPSYISDLKDNETYTISEADGIREYIRNRDFRRIIDTGRYAYVEGHYCLDSPEYIFTDRYGYRHLRPEARENMAACCLVFKITYENVFSRIVNGIVQKGAGRGRKDIKYVDKNGNSAVTDEGLKLREMLKKEKAETGVIRMDFNQMTVALMKEKKVTIQKLADLTGLADETIKNLRNDPERRFQIEDIVAVCIALHLSPETSDAYIKASPSKFLGTDDMLLYQYALKEWYKLELAVVNRKLVEAGARPLTNLVEGYDENGVEIEDRKAM